MNATPSPIRMKTLLVAFGAIVALAALLGMLLGASGSEDEYPTGRIDTVGDAQYDGSGATGSDGSAGDSQYYDGGSIVRDGDGTIYYSDDNGNSISIG